MAKEEKTNQINQMAEENSDKIRLYIEGKEQALIVCKRYKLPINSTKRELAKAIYSDFGIIEFKSRASRMNEEQKEKLQERLKEFRKSEKIKILQGR